MQETATLNGLTNWRENRVWTFYHGTWNFTIFHTSLSPQTSQKLLAWVLNLDPRLDRLSLVFLTIKYRISVVASVCITNLLINLMTRTSILNCTLKQDGILLRKILTSKKTCTKSVKSYWRALTRPRLVGQTI